MYYDGSRSDTVIATGFDVYNQLASCNTKAIE